MSGRAGAEPTIRVFDDPDATSRAAAEVIAAALVDAVAKRGRADWATTGGSSPVGIYRALGEPPIRDTVPWNAVHVWWTDERFVPRDHPQSNIRPLDDVLLGTAGRAGQSGSGEDVAFVNEGTEPGVRIPLENVHAPEVTHAIASGLGLSSAAMEYEAALRAAGLPLDDAGFPILDVVLIGIGGDGHLFSVFPGSPLFDATAWVSAIAAPTHIEPHLARISLHPGFVAAARLPIAVVHGAGKAAILAAVLTGERDERRLPAQLARREGALWLLDRAAAAELPESLLA
jgi:6-phosphogluconolactonase